MLHQLQLGWPALGWAQGIQQVERFDHMQLQLHRMALAIVLKRHPAPLLVTVLNLPAPQQVEIAAGHLVQRCSFECPLGLGLRRQC